MSRKPKQDKANIRVMIKGDLNGQFALGNNNKQSKTEVQYSVKSEEMDELRQILKDLRENVEAVAEPEKRDSALDQVQKLEQAVSGQKPNLSKMESVKNWFGKNIPALAGAVTSVVLHPIVGKLVEAGGDLLVKDFQSRFGGKTP